MKIAYSSCPCCFYVRPLGALPQADLAPITVESPAAGSIYPPDLAPPTFFWHDASDRATSWHIEITFAGHATPIRLDVPGEPLRIGEIDPTCITRDIGPPQLSPQLASAHSWKPDAATWTAIRKHSVERLATLVITGYAAGDTEHPISRGESTLLTVKQPVGAPIFYRDVPLIPSVGENGVISPLPKSAIGLIKWRLRNVGDTSSRVLMEG